MKYWAFLSYSHADRKWADWLHKGLETYRIPRHLIGKDSRDGRIPARVFPIFRDREELPVSSDLGSNIREALRESRYLIVICSRRSAQSRWVGEEIKMYKALGREDRLLALIVEGEPNASDQAQVYIYNDSSRISHALEEPEIARQGFRGELETAEDGFERAKSFSRYRWGGVSRIAFDGPAPGGRASRHRDR